MNRDSINKTIFWSLLYIFLYSACTVTANLYLPNLLLIPVGVSGIIYIMLFMINKPVASNIKFRSDHRRQSNR